MLVVDVAVVVVFVVVVGGGGIGGGVIVRVVVVVVVAFLLLFLLAMFLLFFCCFVALPLPHSAFPSLRPSRPPSLPTLSPPVVHRIQNAGVGNCLCCLELVSTVVKVS